MLKVQVVTIISFRISRVTLSQVGKICKTWHYYVDSPNTLKHHKVEMTQFKDKL